MHGILWGGSSWLLVALMATEALAQREEDKFYKLGPDSLVQEGVPQGKLVGPHTLPCEVFPGTQHTYWVYVPAQYDPAEAGEPDDLQRRPGVHQREWRRPRAERARTT